MIHFICQSPLEKVSVKGEPFAKPYNNIYAMREEYIAYQLVIFSDKPNGENIYFEDISDCFSAIYKVKQVEVLWPHYAKDYKNDYIIDKPDMLSDILVPLSYRGRLRVNNTPLVLWIEITYGYAGDKTHKIRFTDEEGNETVSEFNVRVLPQDLKSFVLNHVQYIDPHSIADSYNVPLYSNVFWTLLEQHMRAAVNNGVTALVLPVYPVIYDNVIPFKRVQLVNVIEESAGKYNFNYDYLDSWLLCMKSCGIKNIVLPPIFPSLQTKECLPIVCKRGYDIKPVFGKEILIDSKEYCRFMGRFIRCLLDHLKQLEFDNRIEFQLTCNASVMQCQLYRELRESIESNINRYHVSDLMPTGGFYFNSNCTCPTICFKDLEFFVDDRVVSKQVCFNIKNGEDAVNMLIATPPARLRALAFFTYAYSINGWFNMGFNYCGSMDGSTVDLSRDTDNGASYPSGSCHLVYPGMGGPLESIRLHQLKFTKQDVSFLKTAEMNLGYNRVHKLLEETTHITPRTIDISSEKYMSFKRKIYKIYESKAKRKEELK